MWRAYAREVIKKMTEFPGFRRPDGRIGVRNHVAVLSAMDNSNATAKRIGSIVHGSVVLTTPFGRTQIGYDAEMTMKTLAGLGCHPNIAAVLVLGLSLDSANALADRIRPCGKPVEVLGLQECGGPINLTAQGARIATDMVFTASRQQREPCPFSDLAVAVECGGSDTTSGIASNPVLGHFADRFVDAGGTIILSEPAEFMGTEHILAERAERPEDRQRIYDMVKWFEDEAGRAGVDMRGINPTPDNIRGGLTTLEEKSLGAIIKGGTRPVTEVIDYADRPSRQGLVVMNTPSAACESMTGLVGGGAQIILFSTGRGNAIGAPIAPTIKVSGNPKTVQEMAEIIDLDVSNILTEGEAIKGAGKRLWDQVNEVVSGGLTRCEILGEEQLAVSRFGPSV
jgi:altronate dehydratase large subunit